LTISKIASSRFSWRGVRYEQHSYSEMGFGTRFLRDQGIGGFLDTVVEEPIGIFRTKDQPCSHRFPKLAVHLLLGVLVNHPQHGELRAVAQAGKLL
jgi:hypothetical protein